MAVKRQILIDYLERNGIETGNAKALYNFTGASGVLVYNNLYSTGDHHISGEIDGSFTPGLSLGKSDTLESTAANTGDFGQFDASGLMQIGSGIDFEDWTVLLSLRQVDPQATDYSRQRILLSSSHNATGISGFNLGVVNNRAFYSYPNTDGVSPASPVFGNYISTSINKEELAEKSVVSLSRKKSQQEAQQNLVEVSVHDFIDNKVVTKQILANDRHSDEWFVGGFYETLNDYTGYYESFDGFINDFIVISGALNESARDDLSKVFFASGHDKEGIAAREVSFTKVTGYSTVDHNAITGSGVTGFDFEKVSQTTALDDDNDPTSVSLYANIGKTGLLTGRKRTFTTGVATGSTIEYTQQPEKTYYDVDLISGYSKDFIVSDSKMDADDVVEIYSYLDNGSETKLSMEPRRILRDGGIEKESSIYLVDSNYSGEHLNVYQNGVYQEPAAENLIINNRNAEGERFLYTSGWGVTHTGDDSVTGILELGIKDGIKSGQKYVVDLTPDLDPSYGSTGYGAIMEGQMGVLTGHIDTVKDEWDTAGFIINSGVVTAARDGLLIVHKPYFNMTGDRLPTMESNFEMTGYADVNTIIRLDYQGDYEFQNNSDIVSSGKFKADDEILYDKMVSGSDRHFIWSGQDDQAMGSPYVGTGISGKMYFNNYYLGTTGKITDSKDINTDIYVNGQKMTSGVNFNVHEDLPNSSGFVVNMDLNSFHPAGGWAGQSPYLISFVPTVSGHGHFNEMIYSGGNPDAVNAGFGLMDEQVWFNGIRSTDYKKASKFSKKVQGVRLSAKTITQYTDLGAAGKAGLEGA